MRPRTHRRLDESGGATTQLVITVPAVLVLSLLSVQFALAWHAQHLAQFTAQRALAAARVKDATAADGRAEARHRLDGLAGRVFTSPTVRVHRSASRASVHVEGRVLPVLPGLRLPASGAAAGPVERLTTPTGTPP